MSAVDETIATWNERDVGVDRVEAEFSSYLEVAKDIGDPGSITAAAAELDGLRTARAAHASTRKPLDEALAKAKSAEAELVAAKEAEAQGSIDKRDALAKFEAVIIASAKLRHWSVKIPGLLASAGGSRERVSRAAGVSTGREVVEQTVRFALKLLEHGSARHVILDAETEGRRAKGDEVRFWKIAEEIARREFAKRLPAERERRERSVEIRSPDGAVRDWRREDPWIPSEVDLDTVFQTRRAAFEAERTKVRAQLQAMSDQVGEV